MTDTHTIAILGSGNVGTALGETWAESGHEIVFGVRDPEGERAQTALVAVPSARLTSVAEAASAVDIVVLAVPYGSVGEVLAAAGSLDGKIVIDATNAVDWTEGPVVASPTSAGEEVQAMTPKALVVKAFNTIGYEHFSDPVFSGLNADMYLCGDDDRARAVVAGLVEDAGFEPIDLGPMRNARISEHLAVAWMWLATRGGRGRDFTFKLIDK